MQVAILSGIATDNGPDVRQTFPVNLVPVPGSNGVSNGYLRPAEGMVGDSVGEGVTRGQYVWDGVLYAVQGTTLVSWIPDGTVTPLGTIADGGPVSWANSFDRLAVTSGGRLYYWDKSSLTEVTDPDLGVALCVIYVQGYFLVTDGENIVATQLIDPTSVRPLDYASSEASPDAVVSLLNIRNQVVALNRTTIEFFINVGGTGFPFSVVQSAQVLKGCIGTNACCVFIEQIAFVGSGFNEAPAIWLANNGDVRKISTIEQDRILAEYTETELSGIVVECRNDSGLEHLYIHLPDRTLVFDATASEALGVSVWFTLTSTLVGFEQYRARYFVWCFDRWNCADPTTAVFGHLSQTVGEHYGDPVRWECATPIVYNESRGAIVHEIELVGLPGRVDVLTDAVIATSYSLDGQTWSMDQPIRAGNSGERQTRLRWFRQGSFQSMRMQRFRGTSETHLSFLRLEARLEGLAR